jgi:hypothetical protein
MIRKAMENSITATDPGVVYKFKKSFASSVSVLITV